MPSTLTPDLEEIMSDIYERYVDLLEDSNIYTAVDFVERAETDSIDEDTADALESIGFHAFFRCYPGGNQDFAMVQLNPKLRISHNDFRTGEYSLYNNAGSEDSPDLDMLASITPNWTAPWLIKGSSNPMIKQLVSALSESGLISHDHVNISDYLQLEQANQFKNTHKGGVDPATGFFSDFYYTNCFKLTTRNEEQISDISNTSEVSASDWEELATNTLLQELATVDPKIVFACGSKAWEYLKPDSPHDQLDRELKSENITDVEGRLFNTNHGWYIVPMTQKSYYDHRNHTFNSKTFIDSFDYITGSQ